MVLFVFILKNNHMASSFGILAKLDFLQTFSSKLIAGVNPAIIHNIEKYVALKKVHYLTGVEHLEGDYLEFGVFAGSSFTHSIRCSKKMGKIFPGIKDCSFYGYDSFEGFGEIEESDIHSFYTDENFATNYEKVSKRVKRAAGEFNYKLIKGFFNETLKNGALADGISKSRVIFIDSDTYSSSKEALDYCLPTIQVGTYVVLDDFFSYKGDEKRGVAKAFNEFLEAGGFSSRKVMDYGMGGSVFVISDM
tara:strand:+ start:149 stop:895 length:747 start_codon:yes stop_codon:yes gene_type:complete